MNNPFAQYNFGYSIFKMLKYNYFSTDNHIELIPNQKPVGSIIWLHGLGANGNDFVPIANELKMDDLALRFIFPHAPLRAVTLNNGHVMPAWFDIYSLDRNQIIDEQGISDSNALLKHYIDHEVEQKI